jgi:colanic acid/amylovoran biosynthesis glycosyltransferase
LLGRQSGVVLEIIYSACDIFCLPSYTEYYPDGMPAEREGIPVALMEAMAWGKPVISTKHAGIPELVEEILVEEKNVQELKSAICYLLDNPDKWKEMGKRNRAIIAEKYSKDNVRILAEIFRRW